MNALSHILAAEPFGPSDPYKHSRIAGGMTMVAVLAAQALKYGDTDRAMAYLREGLEQYDASWALHVWPLTDAEMAQLVAEDEAADRREAQWEACKELADRHGGEQ